MSSGTFRETAPNDESMLALLYAAKLPVDDLPFDGARYFAFGPIDRPLAYCGLVKYGVLGLLRSLVVSEGGRGTGAAMLGHVLGIARDCGVREAWLLTTDAEGFFSKQGFVLMDRALAPPAIAASRQFSELCPDNAKLMRRSLADA